MISPILNRVNTCLSIFSRFNFFPLPVFSKSLQCLPKFSLSEQIAFYCTVYYMLFIYLHQLVFFPKVFFLKISRKRNSIRRRRLCSKNSSTFLFESCSSKFKYIISFFKTISASSAKVPFEICLLYPVS